MPTSPRVRYKGCGAGKESPSHGFAVPAPFRQGGRGGGGTDCHTSDIGHWFAMTHYKKCGVSPDGRTEASAPTECLPIEIRRGRRPRRPASVTRGAVRRADVGIGPYGSATRGAMGGRPQGSARREVIFLLPLLPGREYPPPRQGRYWDGRHRFGGSPGWRPRRGPAP